MAFKAAPPRPIMAEVAIPLSPKVAPMRYLAHALLALALIIVPIAFPIAQATAEEHPFAHQEVKRDAERYETYLKTNWKLPDRKASTLREDGERA